VGLSLGLAQSLNHKIIIMKRGIYSILFLLCYACGAWSQGSVNWVSINAVAMTTQTNATQYSPFFGGGSTGFGSVGATRTNSSSPSYRFALLFGPQYNGSTNNIAPLSLYDFDSWTDSGLSATNILTTPGRLAPVAPNTAAITPVGWDAGHTNHHGGLVRQPRQHLGRRQG
jgi:hypothetical protein